MSVTVNLKANGSQTLAPAAAVIDTSLERPLPTQGTETDPMSARNNLVLLAMMEELGITRAEERLPQLLEDHKREKKKEAQRALLNPPPPNRNRPSHSEKHLQRETEKIAQANKAGISAWNSVQFNDLHSDDQNLTSIQGGDLHRVGRPAPTPAGPILASPIRRRGSVDIRGQGRGRGGLGRLGRPTASTSPFEKNLDTLLYEPDVTSSIGHDGGNRGELALRGHRQPDAYSLRNTSSGSRGGLSAHEGNAKRGGSSARGGHTQRGGSSAHGGHKQQGGPSAHGSHTQRSGPAAQTRRQVVPSFRLADQSTFMAAVAGHSAVPAPGGPNTSEVAASPTVSGIGSQHDNTLVVTAAQVSNTPAQAGILNSKYGREIQQEKVSKTVNPPDTTSSHSIANQKENVPLTKKPALGGLSASRWNPDNAPLSTASNKKQGHHIHSTLEPMERHLDGNDRPSSNPNAAVATVPTEQAPESTVNTTPKPGAEVPVAVPVAPPGPPSDPPFDLASDTALVDAQSANKVRVLYSVDSVLFDVDGANLGKRTLAIEEDNESGYDFVTVTLDNHPVHVIPVYGILDVKVVGDSTITLDLAKPPPKQWKLTFQSPYAVRDVCTALEELRETSSDQQSNNKLVAVMENSESHMDTAHDFEEAGLGPLTTFILDTYNLEDLQGMNSAIAQKLRNDQALFERTLVPGIENSIYADTRPIPRDYVPSERDVAKYLCEKPQFQVRIPVEEKAHFVAKLTKMLIQIKTNQNESLNNAALPRTYTSEEMLALRGNASVVNPRLLPLLPEELLAPTVPQRRTQIVPTENAKPIPTSAAAARIPAKKLDVDEVSKVMGANYAAPSGGSTLKSETNGVNDRSLLPSSEVTKALALSAEQPTLENALSLPGADVLAGAGPIFYGNPVNEIKKPHKSGLETSRYATAKDDTPSYTQEPGKYSSGRAGGNSTMKACKYGENCKNPNCGFSHPGGAATEKSKELCRFLPDCTNNDYPFIHPLCKYDPNCTNSKCKYTHSKKAKTNVQCTFWPKCTKGESCEYDHPDLNVLCKFNPCLRTACPFRHVAIQKRDPAGSMASRRTSFTTAAEEKEEVSMLGQALGSMNLGSGNPSGLFRGPPTPSIHEDMFAASPQVNTSGQVMVKETLEYADGTTVVRTYWTDSPSARFSAVPPTSSSTTFSGSPSRRSNMIVGTVQQRLDDAIQ